MKTLNFSNATVNLETRTGVVLSTDKRSETQISSHGGGGYVGSNGGYVAPPRISSRTVEIHEFWIKDEAGNEVPVQLAGANLPLRIGQTVSVIGACRPNAEQLFVAAVVNHSSGTTTRVLSNEDLAACLGLTPDTYAKPLAFFGAVVAAIGWWVVLNFLVVGVGAGLIGFAAYRAFQASQKYPGYVGSLDYAVRELAITATTKQKSAA